MKQRQLGKSDIQLSSIIMGLWQAGKEMWVGIDDNQTTAAIRAAFEAGITTFDTAEAYGKGHSEMILASALSDVRDKVIYATKVFANHLKYDQVLQACDRSLKNLQTDYIDLYQIHWPSRSVPLEETVEAMERLRQAAQVVQAFVEAQSMQQLVDQVSGQHRVLHFSATKPLQGWLRRYRRLPIICPATARAIEKGIICQLILLATLKPMIKGTERWM